MAYVCLICGKEIEARPVDLEPIVPARIWALKSDKVHYCGHQSAFSGTGGVYYSFLCKPEDEVASYLGLEMRKWEGKIYFHRIEEGATTEKEFGKVLQSLLKEIEFILGSKKVWRKRAKIKALLADKLGGYRERAQLGKFELFARKFIKK